jgi:hypothetical protein
MIDKLQTPHGDDYQEATSSTEYHTWDSSVKYGEEFDAFLAQMAQSFKQPLADGGARKPGASHGNTTNSDSDEEPIGRKRPAETSIEEGDETMQDHSYLVEGRRQFWRLVPVDELPGEEDDKDEDDEDEDDEDEDDDNDEDDEDEDDEDDDA